jgi:hypothetical protein
MVYNCYNVSTIIIMGQFMFLDPVQIKPTSTYVYKKNLPSYGNVFFLVLAGLASGSGLGVDLDVDPGVLGTDLVVGPLLVVVLVLVVPVTDVDADVVAAAIVGIGHGPG